jgi:fatty acid desaturase
MGGGERHTADDDRHTVDRRRLGYSLGYILTTAVALYTMLAFIFTGADDWGQITWPVSIFLLADAAGGYAAHIVTAGDEDA